MRSSVRSRLAPPILQSLRGTPNPKSVPFCSNSNSISGFAGGEDCLKRLFSPGSMSSIKRDVKKKAPPPTGGEIVSRDPAHFSVSLPLALCDRFCSGLFAIPVGSSSGGAYANRVVRQGKRGWYLSVNHGSIRGSWPMAFSGYPREHSVKLVTRCRSTQGRSH